MLLINSNDPGLIDLPSFTCGILKTDALSYKNFGERFKSVGPWVLDGWSFRL